MDMNAELTTVIAGLAAIGLFSSRAFVPAFAVAALLKWGEHIPVVKGNAIIQSIENVPSWFTGDLTVTVLGLLAATEIAATKLPEAREVLNAVDRYGKTAMSYATYLGMAGVLDSDSRKVIGQMMPAEAGFFDAIPGLVIAGGTFFAAGLRNATMGLLLDADPDDDASVQGLIAWAEDIWAFFGVFIFVVFPLLIFAGVAGVLGSMWLARKRAEKAEDNAKVACPGCGAMNYGSAPACGSCHQPMPDPRAVGFFGTTAHQRSAPPLEAHRHKLIEKRRCPRCAGRLANRQIRQTCAACGYELFDRPGEAEDYLNRVGLRLLPVLGVSALFSLVPVVGLIPGIIYYRLALVAPLRRYLPMGKGLAAKIFLKIVFFILIWMQLVPVLGMLAVPLMALMSYGLYRGLFSSALATRQEQAV